MNIIAQQLAQDVLHGLFTTIGAKAIHAGVDRWMGGNLVAESAANATLKVILDNAGRAFVTHHVDAWEVARQAADVAEDAKFGPRGET